MVGDAVRDKDAVGAILLMCEIAAQAKEKGSSVYKELKGFDADFFAHQEEVDLCWRISNSNHKIKYNSKSMFQWSTLSCH